MPRLHPLHLARYAHPTLEQEKVALEETRKVLTSMRDLVRELDLPAETVPLAMQIYANQLAGQIEEAEMAKSLEYEKKVRAEVKARREKLGQVMPVMPVNTRMGMDYGMDPIETQVRNELLDE